MFEKMKYVLIAFSLNACMGVTPDDASLVKAGMMPKGLPTPPPMAFEEYCRSNPEDCKIPTNNNFRNAISMLHNQAKGLVIPTPEEGDHWKHLNIVGAGDCEDFALTLRHLLRTRFPGFSAAFRIATAYTEDGIYHAVLSIETTNGTMVCDIRYPQCAPWAYFPYQWRLREVAGSGHWEDVRSGVLAMATAATSTEKSR